MQEVHINVEEIIKDYAEQVAQLTSAQTFSRAEKTALIARIEELEVQLAETQQALEQVLSEAEVNKEDSRKVIEGELE